MEGGSARTPLRSSKSKEPNAGLGLNTTKSKVMIFRKSNKPTYGDIGFYIDGEKLEVVSEYKYLGTLLSSNLSNLRI